jgi:hypothetical protein
MSAKPKQLGQESEGTKDEVCASCGIAAVDNVKLKGCNDGCDLVKYCSDNCQVNHREQHVDECKNRMAEMHDRDLFTQPDISYMGECPLCFLPLPLDQEKSTMMGCCCKIICNGCNYANVRREREQGLQHKCAFCRNPAPKSEKEADKDIMKRIKKHNDPFARTAMGRKHSRIGEYGKAVEYWTKAAELGNVDAHFCLGDVYYEGRDVEKDVKKAIRHLEKAAIGGHPDARVLLADYEEDKGRSKRAAKHLVINANLGCEPSLKIVKSFFVQGVVSKEEYAAALRGYQAAVDATKSTEREKAEAKLATMSHG